MTLPAYTREWIASVEIDRRALHLWLAVVLVEASLLLAYFTLTTAEPTSEVRYLVYPFVWINAGLWGVRRTTPHPGSRLHRVGGMVIASAYLLVVLYVPGVIGIGAPGTPTDLRVAMYAPGWGPIVAFTSPWLRLYLVPFEVLGYASLAYLVYANVLELTRSAVSGALGLVTCVGCTVPVLTPLVGLLGGPAASLTTTAYAWSYDIGTAIFLLTVAVLSWTHRGGHA